MNSLTVLCKNPSCYKRDVPTNIPDDGLCCPYCGNSYAVHGVDLRKSLKAKEAEEKAGQEYATRVNAQRNYMIKGVSLLIAVTFSVFYAMAFALKGNETGLTILVASFAAIVLLGTLFISRRAGKKFPLEKGGCYENNPLWCTNQACRRFGAPVHVSIPGECCHACGNAYAPKSE